MKTEKNVIRMVKTTADNHEKKNIYIRIKSRSEISKKTKAVYITAFIISTIVLLIITINFLASITPDKISSGVEAPVSMKWNGHDLYEIFPDAFADWIKKPLSPIIDYESNTVPVAMISPDGDKEMTAYLTLFYSDSPDYLELYYFNWAIDTTDMNTVKFKYLYDNANEAWCWFEGLGWPDADYDYPNNHSIADSEVIYDGNSIIWRGNMYSKISDPRWDKLGIKSLSDLESYLSTIFAPDVTNTLMAKCDGGHYNFNYNEKNSYPVFAEFEGVIWKNEITHKWNNDFRNPRYYITESDESRMVLTCEVENSKNEKNLQKNHDYDIEYYEYPFENFDGQWLLTDFEHIW
ncbi:MAG: hypothetical protein ACYCWE_06330 [Eubacteriales bacterium]